MSVVTRFAPSPTGFLHIGGVRTALFNWLFARHHQGAFLLRIEDTDRERSTQAAIDAILEGLDWMGLSPDGDVVYQYSRAAHHRALAEQLLDEGKAYHCYTSPEELKAMREQALAEGRSPRYDGRWRDRPASDAPAGVQPVIRFKAPQSGETTLQDAVQGPVTVANSELDDLIILRADGSPTYNFAVVVDDHDMGVTHVIRGDDHLNNAFRQAQIYQAFGWDLPTFAHVPLIHGSDGAKLSKRHGALGVEAYRDMGYLQEAVFNYLLRLGWSHGDDEIISRAQAIEWFSLEGLNKAAARFDLEKLSSLNSHYINVASAESLADKLVPLYEAEGLTVTLEKRQRLIDGMPGLKERGQTLLELQAVGRFYLLDAPFEMDAKAAKALSDEGQRVLNNLSIALANHDDWSQEGIDIAVRAFAQAQELKLGKAFQPLRAALTGSMSSPSVPEVASVLGKAETLHRLSQVNA